MHEQETVQPRGSVNMDDQHPTVDESLHTDRAPAPYKLPDNFDPREAFRATLKAGMNGKDHKAPVSKAPKPAAAVVDDLEPAEEEQAAEPEEAEQSDDLTAAEEPAEEEETAAEEDLIQNPEALLAAHSEMKEKLTKRTGVLKNVMEQLGVKTLAEVESVLAERLTAPPQEMPVPVTESTPERPLANVGRLEDIKAAEAYWTAQQEWCLENPNGGVYTFRDKNGKETSEEVDADFVKRHAKLTTRVLTKDLPARTQFLETIKAEEKKASEAFPYFATGAPEAQGKVLMDLYTDVKTHVPEIHHYPRISELLADATTGRLIRLHKHGASVGADGKLKVIALTSGKPAPKPAPKTPPVNRAASSAPPARRTDPGEAEMESRLAQGDLHGALRASIIAGFRKKAS